MRNPTAATDDVSKGGSDRKSALQTGSSARVRWKLLARALLRECAEKGAMGEEVGGERRQGACGDARENERGEASGNCAGDERVSRRPIRGFHLFDCRPAQPSCADGGGDAVAEADGEGEVPGGLPGRGERATGAETVGGKSLGSESGVGMGESLQWDRPFIYRIPVQPTPCHRCCPSSPHSCFFSSSSTSPTTTTTTCPSSSTTPSSTSQHNPPPSSKLTDRPSSLEREITIWSVSTAAVPFQSVKSLVQSRELERTLSFPPLSHTLSVHHLMLAWWHGGMVAGMWPSEEAMACYLIAQAHRFRGRRVVELGAGYGLAGMALAVQQQGVGGVLLTDGNDTVVARLSRTVEANRHQFGGTRVAVAALRWDSHPPLHHWPSALSPPFDAVIAAD
ncbi:unnamed protein product, partial [Closterium sp. NIES-54]